MNVHLLKCAIHKEITPAKYSPSEGCLSNWSIPSSGFGNFSYFYSYRECIEDVLPHYKEELELIKVYDSVYMFLFMYDYVLHAFCELWHPPTNTLSTFI